MADFDYITPDFYFFTLNIPFFLIYAVSDPFLDAPLNHQKELNYSVSELAELSFFTPRFNQSAKFSALFMLLFFQLIFVSNAYADFKLMGMGDNGYYQLGDGTTYDRYEPMQIHDKGLVAAAGEWAHSLFITSDGALWAMGENEHGQLGNGTTSFSSQDTPIQIKSGGVKAVEAGSYHLLYIYDSSAGTGSISGQIADSDTGSGISDATVPLSGSGTSETTTDATGNYSFQMSHPVNLRYPRPWPAMYPTA